MNFRENLLISALLHAAIIGAVAVPGLRRETPTQDEERIVEIYFEVVEESAPTTPQNIPEPPVNPEIPESPESPEIPESPDSPDNPEIPEIPDNPETLEDLAPPPAPPPTPPPPAPPPAPPTPPTPTSSAAAEERAKVITDATALNRITPQYPRSARRKGHEGTVTVEVCIEADGSISEAEIVASCGFAELDAAALSAVRTAKFAPATEDGICISGRIRMTFDFRLK